MLSCWDLDVDLLKHVPPIRSWKEVTEHAKPLEIVGI